MRTDRVKEQDRRSRHYRVSLLKQYSDKCKARPCADCGLNYNPWQMDFDHRPGTLKKERISRLVADGCPFEKLRSEIEKCDVVCANCHRQRTHLRKLETKPSRVLEALPPSPKRTLGPDIQLTCRGCGKSFTKSAKLYNMAKRRHPDRGFFCSRTCIGTNCGAGRPMVQNLTSL